MIYLGFIGIEIEILVIALLFCDFRLTIMRTIGMVVLCYLNTEINITSSPASMTPIADLTNLLPPQTV